MVLAQGIVFHADRTLLCKQSRGCRRFEKKESAINGSSILALPKLIDLYRGDDRAGCDPPPKRAWHQPSGV
jgi:hypothetical protein